LRGRQPGDLLVPVSRGLLRVEDRAMSREEYGSWIRERLAHFKAVLAVPSALSGVG
jgi:orotidine-5'-phosphate decarboxylase